MTLDQLLAENYPNITRFIEERGWIEIGESDTISAFVRAYDEGGTAYQGKSSYPRLEMAFQDLEQGIGEFFAEIGL